MCGVVEVMGCGDIPSPVIHRSLRYARTNSSTRTSKCVDCSTEFLHTLLL